MQSFAVPKLTLELPPSISFRLCRYLVVATIPPPTSPLCDCFSVLWLALLSLTASLWCVLILPAASPSTSANLGCILGIPSLPSSAHGYVLQQIVPPAFAFPFRLCQIMIPTFLNPEFVPDFCDLAWKKKDKTNKWLLCLKSFTMLYLLSMHVFQYTLEWNNRGWDVQRYQQIKE